MQARLHQSLRKIHHLPPFYLSLVHSLVIITQLFISEKLLSLEPSQLTPSLVLSHAELDCDDFNTGSGSDPVSLDVLPPPYGSGSMWPFLSASQLLPGLVDINLMMRNNCLILSKAAGEVRGDGETLLEVRGADTQYHFSLNPLGSFPHLVAFTEAFYGHRVRPVFQSSGQHSKRERPSHDDGERHQAHWATAQAQPHQVRHHQDR